VSDGLKPRTRRISPRTLIAVSFLLLFLAVQLGADTKRPPPAHFVDLNFATVDELQQVPGIGPSTAKAIVNFRKKSGPFQKTDDLLAIKCISKGRLEKIRPYLTVDAPAEKSP